ncbi:MAG: polya polymerase [Roseburia sp.]|nr:polya polymerase [Roseburia sp.]MCM1098965.1 polya polymerase [Ruminococcus flavefaciens]
MHIKSNASIVNFLKQVQKCRGDVLFETSEGDRIALKSTLSQYIFCTVALNPELLQSGAIRFEQEDDRLLLAEFLCE